MTEEVIQNPITAETCFVPKTHEGKGRRTAVAPGTTAARFLHYGRITLAAGDPPLQFNSDDHEVGLICLNGKATVRAEGETFDLDRYDAVYVPRDSEIEVSTSEGCDLAEVSAPVEKRYPIKFVSYKEVRQNPKLHLIAGKPPAERDLNVLIGANVEAGRIMAGVTFSTPGNWTSWPHTNIQNYSRKLIFSSTCLRPRLECSLSTPIRISRSWSRSCAKAIAC